MKHIVIFGSGKGSNAINIIEYFNLHESVAVKALVSDKPRRGFMDISYQYRINLEILSGKELEDENWISKFKVNYKPDLIVLAGFLKLIPTTFIKHFEGKIINLHPALLPNFGGKGMYGMHVHKAVLNAEAKVSGITIHHVNEKYDEGQIIFQSECLVDAHETPDSLALKIHQLEHEHLPQVIEKLLIN